MSPILVRPVREQLEHDRIIRLLQAKSRRRFEAGMNPGTEQNVAGRHRRVAVVSRPRPSSLERGRQLQAVVEVETGESVNHLEALAQWAHFAKLRAPFHLYVPSGMVDVARRLCEDNQILVNEILELPHDRRRSPVHAVHRAREARRPRTSRASRRRRAARPLRQRQRAEAARAAQSRREATGKKAAPAAQKRK